MKVLLFLGTNFSGFEQKFMGFKFVDFGVSLNNHDNYENIIDFFNNNLKISKVANKQVFCIMCIPVGYNCDTRLASNKLFDWMIMA